MRCRYCSTVSHTASGFCPNCGMPYDDESFVEDSSEMTNLVDPTEMNSWINPQNPMSDERSRKVPKIQNPQKPVAAFSRLRQLPPVITAAPKKKSHKRTWILLSVLIIVFIAGSGFGYSFSNNRQAEDASGSSRAADVVSIDPEKKEVIDEIETGMLSRTQAVQQLISEGYTNADANSLVDSLNMNWKELALARAKSYLRWCAENELTDYTETSLLRKLVTLNGFTRSEAQWAVAQINESYWFEETGIPGWMDSEENYYGDAEGNAEGAPEEYYLDPSVPNWDDSETEPNIDPYEATEYQEPDNTIGA